MVTLITATADQPMGFALCERFMQAQTVWGHVPLHWIVVDGGRVPVRVTCGQEYIRRRRELECTGAQSLCRNLLEALPRVRTPLVAIIEDDDYYDRNHLARLLAQLAPAEAWIAGDPLQRYYHVGLRLWRVYHNRGASLCQTGFKATLLPLFRRVIEGRLAQNSYGVDGAFWAAVPAHRALTHTATVVGIKGLPGRAGLGVGHRPSGPWTADPELATLREWIGEDADLYRDVPAQVRAVTPAADTPCDATAAARRRLVACYFRNPVVPSLYPRLARVLTYTARQHLPRWRIDVRELPALPAHPPSTPSAENTRKLDYWAQTVIDAPDGDEIVLIDADTMILQPLDAVWRRAFDVAYTIRTEVTRFPFNAGVIFIRVSDRTRAFVTAWRETNRRMFTDTALHREWHRRYGGLNQAALGHALESQGADGLAIEQLPCREWNCEESSWPTFDPAVTRIVHIKSQLRRALFHQAPPTPPVRRLVLIWRQRERAAAEMVWPHP